MSDKLPAPDFDAQHYARANDKWICGNAGEGKPCRLGPDKKGRCQATTECVPVLEKKPGETKGRWRCTRPGDACENGPLPDGACCRPIPQCSPQPTLRTLRGRITFLLVAATCAALLILLGGSWRGNFINPGALSDPHSSAAFAKLHRATNHNDQACAACHVAGASGPAGLVGAALNASPRPWEFGKLAAAAAATMTTIDDACQRCHVRHGFHQANAPREISCSFCHAEHRGASPLTAPTDLHCAFCHGDATLMAAAALKGRSLPPEVMHPGDAPPRSSATEDSSGLAPGHDTTTFPRPTDGYTRLIHGFATDHPEFRVHTEKWRDPDSLKFDHALHLTGQTIPNLPGGKKLDCAYCHQPDITGEYLRPVNFERHCRVCHSLQFDPETPELRVPHGNAAFVAAFLRSLPKQYADVAARAGVKGADEQKRFVERKLQRLGELVSSGEDFERRVFFSTAMHGPIASVGTVSGPERALFPGCAYCHEVKSATPDTAEITPPVLVERWLTHARFNHAKHSSLACARCHAAEQSKVTADVILPLKATCVACHSPAGAVADSCVTCHEYHHQK